MAELLQVGEDLADDGGADLCPPGGEPGVRQRAVYGEALLRVESQQRADKLLRLGGNGVPGWFLHWHELLPAILELLLQAALERRRAAQSRVRHHAEAPQVAGAGVPRLALLHLQHLRRGVRRGTDVRLHAALTEVLTEAPVNDLDVGTVVLGSVTEADVLGLQVAVDDVQPVQVLDGQQDLGGVEPAAALREAACAAKVEEELPARAVLQHEVQLLRRLEGVVQGDDEGVRHGLEHVPLRLRVLHLVAFDHVLLPQHLHRVDGLLWVVLVADQHHFPVRALPNDLQQREVIQPGGLTVRHGPPSRRGRGRPGSWPRRRCGGPGGEGGPGAGASAGAA
mmetsp:Transcript_73663/g.208612  ORF Transcript_73663/g.208612 Transcript_73663/m.208612 type:complete len:338 (+) Transcript_73663:785-1798(+)